jgi:L-lactate dehydrogenase (cytochrome)
MSIKHCYNVMDFRKLAKRRLPRPFWDYLEGSADDGYTFDRNMAAFDDYEIIPRTLVDVAKIDMTTKVLGQTLDWPVFLAPTGASRMWHPHAEGGAARAAAKSGTLYSLSTVATTTIEDVAAASEGPKMFQIYVLRDQGLNAHLIERCKAAKFSALCLTVDVPNLGNRERDLRNGFSSPPKLTASTLASIAMHPRWLAGFARKPDLSFTNIKEWVTTRQVQERSTQAYVGAAFDPTVDWDRAAAMIKQWDGPFAIKGILCVEDARRAVEIGATAVMISNHGGRQLDGVPAPIDLLGDIADAVGERIEVIMDSGIRRGTHVFKALARGAKAVAIGRPYLYALGAGGEPAVDRMLHLLRLEVRRAMALSGVTSLDEITDDHVRALRK